MANQEYTVRLSADTKQAADRISAVQNSLKNLTEGSHDIRVNVDANSIRRSAEHTKHIADNLRQTKASIQEASTTNIISSGTLANATALAGTLYGVRKDVKGIETDLGKAFSKTNVQEFMRTEKFLDRLLDNSRARTREITETYKNVREVPGAANVLGPIENFARAKAWDQYGSLIAEQTLQGFKQGIQRGIEDVKNFFYGDILNEFGQSVNNTIDTLARLGLAIQGVQLLVGPLASAWSAAFDSIIGQNVRLEQTILSTQTTLASTGRIFDKNSGQEITDPLQKIMSLEGGVRQAIDNIRVRSLDLAGVTSQQIIDIFGVVATSIGQVNGDIKDAENLAISFTAALGTLGIPFYQARQEIGSILGGYITEDSLLAKRLQISNADVEKAKNSVDGVVGYLQKKLETAVAGQSIQAKGFEGVTSNIKEIFETLGQRIGQPLLAPLVGGLTTIYEFLKKIQGIVIEVGVFLSSTLAKTITGIANIFSNTKLAKSITNFVKQLARPYEELARGIELGLGGASGDLLDKWMRTTESIPNVMQGIANTLRSLSNFISLQLDLITGPIQQFIDQSRKLKGPGDIAGIGQGIARVASIPFGNIIEAGDTFTKGWDTFTSTLQEAARVVVKFGIALAKLKITEFTAQIRAAAAIFEVFGSVVLGRINLALSFFDQIANVVGSDLGKFLITIASINKLVNSTDFFGAKGVAIWLLQTRQILKQVLGDLHLFVKGFRDAGNIQNLIGNAQSAYANVFNLKAKSSNPVIQNAAQIEQMTQRLSSLNSLQQQMASQGAGAKAMSTYGKAITDASEKLAVLKKTQESFSASERASAAVKSFFGGGTELAAAKEAARQAGVMASGAASAQALSGAMEALRIKLGMSKEEFKSLGGAAKAAGKSIQTFLTTTALINIGFTVASLAISTAVAAWQQYEEKLRAARLETMRMATVNKVLNSGWTSILGAAEGGDIASQNRVQDAQDQIQAQIQQSVESQNKLREEYAKGNDQLYSRKKQLEEVNKQHSGMLRTLTYYTVLYSKVKPLEDSQLKNRKELASVEKKLFDARQAAAKLQNEAAVAKEFEVVAERRRDLEEKIKTMREDYVKEVTDKEFQSRVEIENTLRQIRRTENEQRIAALQEQFRQILGNVDEQGARTLQIVQDYEVALLKAADSEDQRKSELQAKRMQLQKEIEDYAFKMAREKIQLEKQIGGYKKQIEDHLQKKQQIRNAEELRTARQASVLRGIYYQPYNQERQQEFINASGGKDTQFNFAALQLIPKNHLGLTGEESAAVAISKLDAFLKQNSLGKDLQSLTKIAEYFYPSQNSGFAAKIASNLMADAAKGLNLNQWLVKQDPSTLKTPDMNIDWSGMQARIEAAGQNVLELFAQYNAAQAKADSQNATTILNKLKDPATLTEIRSDYTTEIDKANTSLKGLVRTFTNLGSESAFIANELDKVDQAALAGIQAILTRLNNVDPAKAAELARALLAGGTPSGLTQSSKDAINAILNGRSDAIKRVKSGAPGAYQLQEYTKFQQLFEGMFNVNKILESRSSQFGDLGSRLNDLVKSSGTGRYSLADSYRSIDTQMGLAVADLQLNSGMRLSESQLQAATEAALRMGNSLKEIANILDPVNKALQELEVRTQAASQATETLYNANRSFVEELLNGSGMKDAFANFSQSIAKGFTQQFLDFAMTPLKDQIFDQMKRLFGVTSAQERAQSALQQAGRDFITAVNKFAAAVDRQVAAPGIGGPDLNADTSGIPYGIRIGDTVGTSTPLRKPKPVPVSNVVPLQVQPYTESDYERLNRIFSTSGEAGVGGELKGAFDGIGDTLTQLGDTASNGTKNLGKFLGAMTGVATGALAITGAIQAMQSSKGGTYETLMGIAGVLGGLGSIFGGIAGMRAAGGPVTANRPYVVGEVGPELFVPSGNGTILPNSRMGQSPYAASSAYLEQQTVSRSFRSDPIKVDTRIINSVEYVTASQLQEATRQAEMRGAERGQAMSLASLQNSVRTRKRIGL